MEHGHFPFSIIMGNDILDISETTDVVHRYQGYRRPIANPSARNSIGTRAFPQTDRLLPHSPLNQKLCTQLAYLSHFWSGQLTCKRT